MEIFLLEYGFGDFSFEKWRFFLSKICLWRFFLEDLFWRLFHWKFLRRFVHGDFSFGIWFWKSFLWKMEIFTWRFILRDFSIEVLEIFIKDLFIGDFSFGIWFWRFFLWKMEIFHFEDLFMEIFPWRFIMEIFPLNF